MLPTTGRVGNVGQPIGIAPPALSLPFAVGKVLDPRLAITRNSAALQVGSTGFIEFAPENLCENTDNFSTLLGTRAANPATSSVTDPNGGTSAYVLKEDGTGTATHYVFLSGTVEEPKGSLGRVFTYAASIKAGTRRWVAIGFHNSVTAHAAFFDLGTGVDDGAKGTVGANLLSSSMEYEGDGWYRCAASGIAGVGAQNPTLTTIFIAEADEDISFSGTLNAESLYLYHPQIERHASPRSYLENTLSSPLYNQPRFTHDIEDGESLGLRLQCAAVTQLLLQTEALGITWTNPGGNTLITANAGVAPNGLTVADDVKHGDSAETIQQTLTVADNTVHRISAFVAQGTTGSHDWVKIALLDESAGDNGFEAWFNISTGVVGTAQATGTGSYTASSIKIQSLLNGGFRISAAGQIVSGQTDARFEIINTTADAVDTAEATNSVFWWGLNVTAGTDLAEYIPATTAQETQVAEVVTSTSLGHHNGTAGGIYFKGRLFNTSAAERSLVTYDDGGTTDQIRLYMDAAENVNFETINSGDTNGASDGAAVIAIETDFKAMGVWADDDVICYVNGTASAADSAAGLPVTDAATTLRIGDDSDGTPFDGTVAEIKEWASRPSNSRADTETT